MVIIEFSIEHYKYFDRVGNKLNILKKRENFQKVNVFFNFFHKFITIMIKILNFLFKVKQQHTGKHWSPYIEEPVQESPGDLVEKNQYSCIQEPSREKQVTIYFY